MNIKKDYLSITCQPTIEPINKSIKIMKYKLMLMKPVISLIAKFLRTRFLVEFKYSMKRSK